MPPFPRPRPREGMQSFDDSELLEDYKPADPREQAWTRRLAVLWALVAIVLFALLCYFLSQMVASIGKGKDAARVGALSDFPAGSIQSIFINPEAPYSDPETSKELATLALLVEHDSAGSFRVWFARSTLPIHGVRAPRDCLVTWQEDIQRYQEPCGGSRWTRDGKYVEGPAPRDMDQFPTEIRQDQLWIKLQLAQGAPHP